VPRDFQRDLRHLYLSLLELLKHFWNCFPPTTEELETKLQRMHETLQRFKMAKLVPFEVSSFIATNGVFYSQHSLSLYRIVPCTSSRHFDHRSRNTWTCCCELPIPSMPHGRSASCAIIDNKHILRSSIRSHQSH